MVQSLMVLFFHLRFGVSLTILSALFFGANLLSALSFLSAVPLAKHFGLNTMVFTHLPSNIPRDAQRAVVFKRSGSKPSFVAFMVAALRQHFNSVASKQAIWSG